jgi:uncharacterized membrane protein YqaE (UPF0057 family)
MKRNQLKSIVLGLMAILLFVPASFAITLDNVVPDEQPATTVTTDQSAADNAMSEFKSLSKQDKKERLADAKKQMKQYKKDKKAGNADSSENTLLLVILAILLPPLAVYLHEGAINGKFWLDLLLTLLFYLPGLIYALIVIL